MKGLIFLGDRRLELAEIADPTPGDGEVVVAIKASGMCGSDLHLYRAAVNPDLKRGDRVVGGHEPSGVVVAVGSGVPKHVAKIDERVMVHHYSGCSVCAHCRTGWPQLCSPRTRTTYSANAHGAHAPFMKVHASTLIPLDDALSYEAGAAISCGTGTAWGAIERLQVRGGETIAVFGQGPVGLSATLIAASMGARVVAVDLDPHRLSLASSFGAHSTINATSEDPTEALLELTKGLGVSSVIETSGSGKAASAGLKALAVWGKLALVGIGSTLNLETKALLDRQVTVMTSYTMSTVGQKACADFIVQRSLNVDAIFTDRWRLEQADEAYRVFDSQATGKGVFLF